jgi:hypothetical protein
LSEDPTTALFGTQRLGSRDIASGLVAGTLADRDFFASTWNLS